MAVVEGRLQLRDWTDRDGNKRRSAEVVADNVYFGDSKARRRRQFRLQPRLCARPRFPQRRSQQFQRRRL